MTLIYATYFAIALGMLLGLGQMILRIGRALGECPQTGQGARLAAVPIATGFVAIGMGGVLLVATMLAVFDQGPAALFFALGFACMVLGLGFAHAVAKLRDLNKPVKPATVAPAIPAAA
jgi:hypothetical protein